MYIYKRSDFEFSYPPAVRCVNPDYKFERPSRLTKWDVATILNAVEPELPWTHIYDAFKYAELVDRLNTKLS